jgi:hypothetical protein
LDRNVRVKIQENPSFLEHIASDPEFVKLVAQIKFFSGRVGYTPMELNVLESWFEADPLLADFFDQEVLRYKSKALADFKDSPLKTLIDVERRKVHDSKYFDDILAFESGTVSERKDAYANFSKALASGELRAEAGVEIEKMLTRIYNRVGLVPSPEAIELHLLLVEHNLGKELAWRALETIPLDGTTVHGLINLRYSLWLDGKERLNFVLHFVERIIKGLNNTMTLGIMNLIVKDPNTWLDLRKVMLSLKHSSQADGRELEFKIWLSLAQVCVPLTDLHAFLERLKDKALDGDDKEAEFSIIFLIEFLRNAENAQNCNEKEIETFVHNVFVQLNDSRQRLFQIKKSKIYKY